MGSRCPRREFSFNRQRAAKGKTPGSCSAAIIVPDCTTLLKRFGGWRGASATQWTCAFHVVNRSKPWAFRRDRWAGRSMTNRRLKTKKPPLPKPEPGSGTTAVKAFLTPKPCEGWAWNKWKSNGLRRHWLTWPISIRASLAESIRRTLRRNRRWQCQTPPGHRPAGVSSPRRRLPRPLSSGQRHHAHPSGPQPP